MAIDEGKTAGNYNLDFVLENPTSSLNPFPVVTEIMMGIDAESYCQHLLNGLAENHRYKINFGTVICDGNYAQKKAFSYSWRSSLRYNSDYP